MAFWSGCTRRSGWEGEQLKRWALIMVAAVALAGCAHNLTFVNRETGERGTATVKGGSRGGDIQITLGDKIYNGTWIFESNGGSIGFANGTAFSGTAVASASGMMFSESTAGGGTILASTDDGSTLRCQFSYNQMGNTGLGVCQDNHNGVYDLQIH